MDHRVETRNTSEYSPNPRVEKVERRNSEFLPPWKFWSITASGLLTLVLLCRPWLMASGPHGDVQSDAFGRLDGSVPALRSVGERLTEGMVSISGLCGMLAAAAAVITVAGVCSYRLFGVGLSAVVVAGPANAVLVPVTLLYLNGKAPELREMTEYHDELKTTLGDIVNTLLGGTPSTATAPQVATVTLTNEALICALVAMVTGAVALSMRNLIRPSAGLAAVPVEAAHAVDPSFPPAVDPGMDYAAEPGLEQELDLVMQYTRQLPDAVRYVYDDDHGVGNQRLLSRTDSLRRADSQFGSVRRERPTARRRRPRSANRTPAVPPTATAKRSAGNCGQSRSARPVVSG